MRALIVLCLVGMLSGCANRAKFVHHGPQLDKNILGSYEIKHSFWFSWIPAPAPMDWQFTYGDLSSHSKSVELNNMINTGVAR